MPVPSSSVTTLVKYSSSSVTNDGVKKKSDINVFECLIVSGKSENLGRGIDSSKLC